MENYETWIGVSDFSSWDKLCEDECFVEIYNLYLQEHPSGGSLHIVLSDWNNSDGDIVFCYNWAKDRGDVAGMWLATKLISVDEEDRNKYNWKLI